MFYLHCIHALQLRRIIVFKFCADCQPAHDYQVTQLHSSTFGNFFEFSSAWLIPRCTQMKAPFGWQALHELYIQTKFFCADLQQ